jgi:hypothetical protein
MFESAITDLSAQYTVTDIIDLNKFESRPQKELYYRVESCKKDVFENHERILILVPSTLKKTFVSVPADILIDLQKYIKEFDIPHYFLIVVTDIPTIKKDLNFLKRYTNDTQEIECCVV